MKHNYFAALCLFCFFQAQNGQSQNLESPCGADYWRVKALQDPVFFQKNEDYEQGILQVFQQKNNNLGLRGQVKVLPTVVHIIHNGGTENITDAQVQQAIAWLNQALANQGPFDQGSGANCGIQLCLAQRTPDGQATNGITRDQSLLTEMKLETQDIQLKNLNRWKPKDYVNIWLVRSICSDNYGCGVYGYSNYPFAHGSNIDGIVIEAGYLTEIEKISGLAHEMGHYLGLYHSFEGGCNNNNCMVDGDRICDTPPDKSTAGVPCTETVNTCSTDTQSGPFPTDQPDMSWNFMDYGIIACFHDFTPDQATRMNASLEGVRHSLLDSKGCLLPCPTPASVAAFSSSANLVYVGQSVTLTNNSQNAGTYEWSFNGQIFSSQTNPTYTFTTPGLYNVVLVAQPSNTLLCESDTAHISIQVACAATASLTVSDNVFPLGETVFLANTSQNASTFEWFVNGVSYGPVLDSILFADEGEYEISLVASDGVCSSTTEQFVYVLGEDNCDYRTFQFQYDLPGDTSTLKFGYQAATVLADSTILFSTSTKSGEVYFIKSKANGQFIWVKKITALPYPDEPEGGKIAQCATRDKGFAVILPDTVDGISRPRILAKFSADGVFEWSRVFQDVPEGPAYLTGVIASNDGNLVVCGGFEAGGLLCAKFDLAGNQQWSQHFKIPNVVLGLDAIVALPDGDYFAVGRNQNRLVELRIKANGTLGWRRSNTVQSNINYAKTYKSLYYSSFEVIFYAESGDMLVMFDTSGVKFWAVKFPQNSFAPQKNLEMVLCGKNEPGTNVASLARTSASPNPVWGKLMPNTNGNLWDVVTNPNESGYFSIGTRTDLATNKQKLWLVKLGEYGEIGDCTPQDLIFTHESVVLNPAYLGMAPLALPVSNAGMAFVSSPGILNMDTVCAPACVYNLEICDNGLDDDGDNLFDCLDPDCPCSEDQCNTRHADIWYFGNHSGLDFSTDPPKVLTDGVTYNFNISATICDVKGNLLFYAGESIFNRFHQPTPNGNVASYDPIIVPYPGNPKLFYIISDFPVANYHLFDMSLDDGRGDIASSFLFSQFLHGMVVVKSCSFNGYWLLSRRVDNFGGPSDFLAYKIDENGLDPDPVVSPTGQVTNGAYTMKIAPNGTRVANAFENTGTTYMAIYDFDPSFSGTVSNARTLMSFQFPYQVNSFEFSPNSRYLYASGFFPGNATLIQFDLEAGDLNAIKNSMVVIASGTADRPGKTLQLAPNGKIYVLSSANIPINTFTTYLDIIHLPNAPGLTCQYQEQGLDLSPTGGAWSGLCNVIASYLAEPYIAFPDESPDTICTLNSPINYQISNVQCTVDSITWATENLSTEITPNGNQAAIRFISPGSGRIIVKAFSDCGNISDTLEVLVVAPLNKTLDLGPDLLVCQNGIFSFNAGSGFARYQWSDGTADSTLTTLFPGKYWVNAWDFCGNLQTDTITISIAPNSVLDLGPDLPQQCPGLSSSFQRPANFVSWQWSPSDFLSCTDCPNITASPLANARWIVVGQTIDGCISVDTMYATIRDTLLFSRDTFVCEGQTIALYGAYLPADTTAQFLLPAPGLGCDTLLTVNVLSIENAASELSVTICANAIFDFNGTLLPADTVAIFHLPSSLACDSVVTVKVNSFPPLTLTLPMDTTIRIGASVLLKAETMGAGTLDFMWSPGEGLSCIACPDPVANPFDTITYTLAVTDANGCTVQESVTIRVNEECRVHIPNAFTPNGDGSNDRFRPIMDPCVRTVRLWRIVNRWGETVFEQFNSSATDPNLGWDGSWKGQAHPSDILVWVAEFEFYDGRRESQKGEVTLIR